MKVLAVNGSPKMDKGNTAMILGPFLEGMEEAQAEVEILYTNKLNINPCQGEYNCWIKTPGKCFQKDDMEMVLSRLQQADIWVWATPVYVDGMTGPLKNLIDRLIPLGQPFIELRDGHCRHPGRKGAKNGQLVLVSNCGFWELDNFDPLLVHMKAICKNINYEFAGALLRPHGHVLKFMQENKMPVDDIFAAARNAGRELITEGRMSVDNLKIIRRDLAPRDMFIQRVNESFQQALNALKEK